MVCGCCSENAGPVTDQPGTRCSFSMQWVQARTPPGVGTSLRGHLLHSRSNGSRGAQGRRHPHFSAVPVSRRLMK
jgi:hypothetical protein